MTDIGKYVTITAIEVKLTRNFKERWF